MCDIGKTKKIIKDEPVPVSIPDTIPEIIREPVPIDEPVPVPMKIRSNKLPICYVG